MKTLHLERFAYSPTETQGRLNNKWWSIERPWIKGDKPGGLPFESCIPDGDYKLIKHTRPNGDKVVALENPELGVWYQKEDRPTPWGRYLILIHSGNYVEHVVGCIAPGVSRTIYENRVMVGASREAMKQINVQKYDHLTISPTSGAQD